MLLSRITSLQELLHEYDEKETPAIAHLWRAYYEVCKHVSVGKMRAGPPTDRAAKKHVEGYDVDTSQAPHG